MRKKLFEQIDELICVARQEQELAHILPVLEEVRRAAEKGPRFDSDDIARVAALVAGLGDDSSALERASEYSKEAGPNMFARALLAALTRQASEK